MHLSSRWRPGPAILLAALLLAGCGKKSDSDKGGSEPRNPLLGQPQPGAGGLRRVADRPKVQTDLTQMATLYTAFNTDRLRYPNTEKEFQDYLLQDPNTRYLGQAMEKGLYGVVVTQNPGSATVLVYEKQADANGNHIVVTGLQGLTTMTDQELQNALKKPGG